MSTGLIASGFSDAAQYVDRETRRQRRRLSESNAFGIENTIHEELAGVWETCREADWDGFGAEPITEDALRNAYLFLESLPWGLTMPSIGAEPDGQVTLEWHKSAWRTLSVSVTPDGDLHYAALIGPNKSYGTEAFFGEAPAAIIELIRRIYTT